MAAQASVTQLVDQIEDPVTQRAMFALLSSVQLDLQTIATKHDAHFHLGAATVSANTGVPVAPNLVGNLNTIK